MTSEKNVRVEGLASPMKPEAGYESSNNELSNTSFMGQSGQRHDEGGQDDRALLDQIYWSQQDIREVLHYNIESSCGLADRMSRMEGLLQQLVDLQILNLRSASCQSKDMMVYIHVGTKECTN